MSKSNGNGCLKGCGCFVVILLIIVGVLAGGGYYLYKANVYTTPEKVEQVSQEICSITLPENFSPVLGFNLYVARVAIFMSTAEEPAGGAVCLISIKGDVTNKKTLDIMRNQFIANMLKNQSISGFETKELDSITMADGTQVNRMVTEVKVQGQEEPIVMQEASFQNGDTGVVVAAVALDPAYSDKMEEVIKSIGKPTR